MRDYHLSLPIIVTEGLERIGEVQSPNTATFCFGIGMGRRTVAQVRNGVCAACGEYVREGKRKVVIEIEEDLRKEMSRCGCHGITWDRCPGTR